MALCRLFWRQHPSSQKHQRDKSCLSQTGEVDVALGSFTSDSSIILAPLELKGAKTRDLDAIMAGRNKTPVQQAWEYAMDAKGAQWVMVSMRGGKIGLTEQDFDPPEQPAESLAANIVELYFPSKLYIADVLPEVLEKEKGRKIFNQRKRVREYAQKSNRKLPSGFEVSGGKLITFYNLEESHNPFSMVIDDGTVEEFSPGDFHKIDDDHERVFKSLLRLCLQHQLYKQQVLWKHEEGIFIFLPMKKEDDARSVTWMGQKKAVRSVFERKYMDKDPSKVLSTRHFAFSVDFLVIEDNWYASITPNWFFSYAGRNGEYEYSKFGDKLLSGLKRMEKNRSVYDQFRFLAAWLKELGTEDLFSATSQEPAMLTFGNILKFEGGRFLNESLWEPLAEVDVEPSLQGALGV